MYNDQMLMDHIGHRRQVHLRREIRRRELQARTQQALPPVHGQRRPEHQRLAVRKLKRAPI